MFFKILMRSYLSDLRVNPKGVPGGHNPFPGKRPIFLHLLPPFAVPEHISLIKLEVSIWIVKYFPAYIFYVLKSILIIHNLSTPV